MNKASTPVLDLLADAGVAMNPKGIMLNLRREMDDPPSRRTVFRCFSALEEHGFIENVAEKGSYYVITDRGRAYLDDELSQSEIDDLRDDRD